MHRFSPEVFAWFEGLEAENTREYFNRTKPFYEEHVRGGLIAVFDVLEDEFGPGYKIFRQRRDLRFTKDKTPYKTRTYGILGGSFYAELSSRGLYAGSGRPPMRGEELKRFRAATKDPVSGPQLEAALPDGYEIERTGPVLIAGRRIAPGPDGVSGAAAFCVETWRACAPMNTWLDEHVGPGPR